MRNTPMRNTPMRNTPMRNAPMRNACCADAQCVMRCAALDADLRLGPCEHFLGVCEPRLAVLPARGYVVVQISRKIALFAQC
jgi:hypothetical protein